VNQNTKNKMITKNGYDKLESIQEKEEENNTQSHMYDTTQGKVKTEK